MRVILVTVMCAAFLAGCGNKKAAPKKDALLTTCMEQTDKDERYCGCMTQAMKDGLSSENYQKLLDEAKDGKDPETIMRSLADDPTDVQTMAELTEVGKGLIKCDPSLLNDL